jgi:hypothetical protein
MYGYTEEEAKGRPIDIVILDDPKRHQEELDIRERIAGRAGGEGGFPDADRAAAPGRLAC